MNAWSSAGSSTFPIAPEPVWHASAFGLQISAPFPAPGLQQIEPGGRRTRGRRTVLRMCSSEEFVRLGHGEEAAGLTLFDRAFAGNRMWIVQDRFGAYLIHSDHFGRFRVNRSGGEVICAPHALPDWYWQRFLVGQVLPLAALQHGLEPLHASAVEIDGRALLCLGASGAGKTSTALHMVALGAQLLTDDVVATEVNGQGVLAHPGAALVSVDRAELHRLASVSTIGGWTRLGIQEGEVRLVTERRAADPVRVSGLYILVRDGRAGKLSITDLPGSPTTSLLGATFNAYVREGKRLLVQLEVCGELAETASVRRVSVPSRAGASDVARAVMADAEAGGR